MWNGGRRENDHDDIHDRYRMGASHQGMDPYVGYGGYRTMPPPQGQMRMMGLDHTHQHAYGTHHQYAAMPRSHDHHGWEIDQPYGGGYHQLHHNPHHSGGSSHYASVHNRNDDCDEEEDDEEEDDEEEDDEEIDDGNGDSDGYQANAPIQNRAAAPAVVAATMPQDDSSDSDSDDSAAPAIQPRGKPEAMAARLASAARVQEKLDELEAELEESTPEPAPAPIQKPAKKKATKSNKKPSPTVSKSKSGTKSVSASSKSVSASKSSGSKKPSGPKKPTVSKKSTAPKATGSKTSGSKTTGSSGSKATSAASKTTTPSSKTAVSGSKTTASTKVSASNTSGKSNTPKNVKRKKSPGPKKSTSSTDDINTPSMDDPVRPITEPEYENLESLMVQFCRVPLLAEFSRPVALLHPELIPIYSKIVDNPIDLGKVCRRIRRRQYSSLRAVRLDTWRIFANCVKYHSHPSNKDAVPSFVSIALHLRDYFNALWQEYIVPSDVMSSTKSSVSNLQDAIDKRREDRKKRLSLSAQTALTGKSIEKTANVIENFVENGGCVDKLDGMPLFGDEAEDEDEEMDVVVENLMKFVGKLREKVRTSQGEAHCAVEELDQELRRCYTEDVLETNPAARNQIANRLDRLVGKITVPIHEASSRGVTQSSIWGCMAAAVWARESSKKPFWPALVLGIMAPEDQREDWHIALTARNEARLPEKLRGQLAGGKKKSEQAVKRQSLGQMEPQSFFLVEFLGTHEFIWVRESDIVEGFDPEEDPNQNPPPGAKKKRSARNNSASITGSKMYQSAVEEGRWALEEFELQLQDTCGDMGEMEEEEDGEEMNYSYNVLCQSDDEADEEEEANGSQEGELGGCDIDEANELLATDGLLDFSPTGRKNAKKRAQALKKQKAINDKKQKADKAKKVKAEQSKKKQVAKSREREEKKEQRDLEKRRKKRGRERERALKANSQKTKKRRLSSTGADEKKASYGRRNVIADKRERAVAVVNGYLQRASMQNKYKDLGLGGVMTIPAALVDSSGLLGMALAFRAASGELAMPEESGVRDTSKPWDAIKVENKKKSSDRQLLLTQQISLLEEEIERVRSETAKRKELTGEALKQREELDAIIEKEDKMARKNPFQKNKKPVSAPGSGRRGVKRAKLSNGKNHNSASTAENHVDVESVDADGDNSYDKSSPDQKLGTSFARRDSIGDTSNATAEDISVED